MPTHKRAGKRHAGKKQAKKHTGKGRRPKSKGRTKKMKGGNNPPIPQPANQSNDPFMGMEANKITGTRNKKKTMTNRYINKGKNHLSRGANYVRSGANSLSRLMSRKKQTANNNKGNFGNPEANVEVIRRSGTVAGTTKEMKM